MTCSDPIRKAAQILENATTVLIGAGTGLSAAAGVPCYADREHFKENFGDFADRYGILDERTGGYYPFRTQEEYWAWWSRAVYLTRYAAPTGQPYIDLHDLVRGKDYFVVTTNIDGQFLKAGFDRERVLETKGDYGLFQCATPCTRKTYENEESVRQMYEAQENMRVPPELIPICPGCGGPMTINLRTGDHPFVEDARWDRTADAYTRFIRKHQDKPIVYLEIGVGNNTPHIIKYAFWQMTDNNPLAHYIMINAVDTRFPKEIKDRSVAIRKDAAEALSQMVRYEERAVVEENQDTETVEPGTA